MMATKPMDPARNAIQITPIKEAVKRRNRNMVEDPEIPEPEAEAEAGRKTAGQTAEEVVESNHRTATGTRTVTPSFSHVPSTSTIQSATIPVVVSD